MNSGLIVLSRWSGDDPWVMIQWRAQALAVLISVNGPATSAKTPRYSGQLSR